MSSEGNAVPECLMEGEFQAMWQGHKGRDSVYALTQGGQPPC